MDNIVIENVLFKGSYSLDIDIIDWVVPYDSNGVYLLGKQSCLSNFYPCYVGRSDNDLADRLKDHVGKYPLFCFKTLSSEKEAFKYECFLYHKLGENISLDNKIHPDSPNDMELECPYCKKNNLNRLNDLFLSLYRS